MKTRLQAAQNKCIRFCLKLDDRFRLKSKEFERINWFTGRKRTIVRHRIQNVIFEGQMKTFDEPIPSKVARSIPSAAAAANTS